MLMYVVYDIKVVKDCDFVVDSYLIVIFNLKGFYVI